MNTTDVPIAPTLAVRLTGASCYLLIDVTSIILNGLLAVVLFKVCTIDLTIKSVQDRKVYSNNAFYMITWQHLICDVVELCLEFVLPVPTTFSGTQVIFS